MAYDIILVMNEKWNKYDYVCSLCDALIEITTKSNVYKPQVCCGEEAIWLSVVDATIYPTTKKEDEMITETPAQTITLTWIENDLPINKTYTENEVRSLVYVNKANQEKANNWYLKENKLRTLLHEVYADSEDQDTLAQIADIFDVPLTKEIEVTVYIRVDATVEVDLTMGEYDLEDMVRNQITIDAYGSELNVNDYEIERVEEGAY